MPDKRTNWKLDREQEGISHSLLRLIHCMDVLEQSELVYHAVEILGRRCSLDPGFNSSRDGVEVLEAEIAEDLARRIRAPWSWDEPSSHWIDLRNMGDPGFWIEDGFERPAEGTVDLLFWKDSYKEEAARAAERYLSDARENGSPLPSDFSTNLADENETVDEERECTDRFIELIKYWREQLIQTLERQNPVDVGANTSSSDTEL